MFYKDYLLIVESLEIKYNKNLLIFNEINFNFIGHLNKTTVLI